MTISPPSMPIPSRVLELERRFAVQPRTVGNDADAFIFGQQLEAASDASGPVAANVSVGAADGVARVDPAFHGAVINADGTLADDVPYADLFRAAGAEHGIQPSVLAAVAKAESAFDPTAVSHAGAQGLMQFMPGTAAEMGVDPWDPASAIDGAARYLTQNLRRFGSLELALAAYNAGPGAVQRYDGIPPFEETQAYVPKVLAFAGLDTNGATS
jgi:soluble lytic murein transglycosylase-like protein